MQARTKFTPFDSTHRRVPRRDRPHRASAPHKQAKRPWANFLAQVGLHSLKLGLPTRELNRGEFTKRVDALRAQIKADEGVKAELYPERLNLANTLLAELAIYEIIVPELKTPIATLRVTLSAYYSRAAHRPWARQYALQDLEKLTELSRQIPEE